MRIDGIEGAVEAVVGDVGSRCLGRGVAYCSGEQHGGV